VREEDQEDEEEMEDGGMAGKERRSG